MPLPARDEVAVIIDGRRFRAWSGLELTHSVDTFSTFSFLAPSEPDRKEFRDTFRPFSFKPLQILLGGAPLFTGTLVGVAPVATAEGRSVEVSGYAFPGVLADCNPPGDAVPFEFKKMGLRAIAEALAKPFGIKVEFRADEGAKFDKVKLEEDDKIFAFLTELAQQRNRVWSNTAEGRLLCWASVETGNPVAVFDEGRAPFKIMISDFDPQNYFSEITGFSSAKRGRKGSKYTERNHWLEAPLRPMSFKLDQTEKADTPEAVRAKLGRMFANMASFTLDQLPTWRDPKGRLFEANTTIKVKAPSVMVYRLTELLIRRVTFRHENDEDHTQSAALEVVLPGAFSGKVPDSLPWDEP